MNISRQQPQLRILCRDVAALATMRSDSGRCGVLRRVYSKALAAASKT
jgi:hypothetical protein